MRHLTRHVAAAAMLLATLLAGAQDEPQNTLTLDANLMGRGELRYGGLPGEGATDDGTTKAKFVSARTRLSIGYERSFLSLRITAQHSGVWGQAGKGSLNLSEAWAKLQAKNGLFAKVGRQDLNYDDERILGRNDWAMTASSHDALKLGYEGHGHKFHVIMSYNQRAENTSGGTTYRTTDGAYPYKTMVTAWYHYDLPRIPLGASVLFMNAGLQNPDEEHPKTNHQQLIGGYIKYHPARWTVEGAYYRQMGKDEFHVPISAWMASAKAEFRPNEQWKIHTGYDYLSGDDNPIIPAIGGIGLAYHSKVKGFSAIYGSHHKFYGAMDFFYLGAYYGGYTPGLQNLFAGATYKPIKPLEFSTAYHYLRVASDIHDASPSLGHMLEFTAGYTIIKDVKLSAGYTYMHGTNTLERLQRVEGKNNLHWAWLMINITPNILTKKF